MKLASGVALAAACLLAAAPPASPPASDGLLVIAHGARMEGWNERVIRMVDQVEWTGPKGVAFLSPRTPDQELANVADRLEKAGARRIVIVPLLVSSFSDHYEEIRYYGRDRKDAPPHHEHGPLKTTAELLVSPAMDSDRLLGRILVDQIRSVSQDPAKESVMLVAHGPNDEVDNERWMACLKVQAAYLQKTLGFRRVDAATIRDDAPKPVKDAAIAGMRDRVQSYGADSKALILPVLISVGRLQAEIAGHLKGIDHVMSKSGVSTHPLTAEWIRQQAITELRARSVTAQSQR
jgi:sirohydrochlorin ferrochelatase